MGVPLSQMWAVASYVVAQKLRRRKRYPLVLMLEPLLRCNLACAGCGKIQHPPDVLRRELSVTDCLAAAEECGAPIVSIAGGEPLLHAQIDEIVSGMVAQRRFVYLCTNGLRLEESLPRFQPSCRLSFSVHLDGPRLLHDRAVCREGTYTIATEAIRAAVSAGFRVTTNTTIYDTAAPEAYHEFFDELMRLGVEGMMISPGYAYEKAPDQDHFLRRENTIDFFRRLMKKAPRRWRFNQSPVFLEFLQGLWDLPCTPWGNPTYNLFGWQRPCYLLDAGYAANFSELLQETPWQAYGRHSGNPQCRDCMVHCGYEPSAVGATLGSLRGLWAASRAMVLGPKKASARQPIPPASQPRGPLPCPASAEHCEPEVVQIEVSG